MMIYKNRIEPNNKLFKNKICYDECNKFFNRTPYLDTVGIINNYYTGDNFLNVKTLSLHKKKNHKKWKSIYWK